MDTRSKLAAAMFLIGAAATVQAAEPLQIASISGLEGKVMIHKGANYTLAKEGQALVEGDRVVALRESKANVAFNSGCVANVVENSVLAIDGSGNCAARKEPLKVAQAIGGKTDVPVGGGDVVGGGLSRGAILAGIGVAGLSAPLIVNATTANEDGGRLPISGQ